ncbi:MAG: fructosamine kinase family protein [Planctomycetes bacterium]|nr:fructosamine kinase family protein [Planctomycetota bacterium]MCP4840041.1 fructosamine kinase family protein [Planctomycetota bacterium]
MSVIQKAIRSLELCDIVSVAPLAGGSIHDVQLVDLNDGTRVVCKVANGEAGHRMLEAEQRGLALLAEPMVLRVPCVLGLSAHDDTSVLVLEYLPPGDNPHWRDAGQSLAALHEAAAGVRYGSEHEVWLGTTCFPAGWSDDWAEWIAERRLRPLLRSVADAGLMDAAAVATVEAVIDRLGSRIPRHPRPSILHGDLWSGNIHVMTGGQVAFLDPACFIGDAWMDPAMTLLFGGVPTACVDAWKDCQDDREQENERIAVGQAMHLLNHVYMFGASYAPRLMDVVSTLA